MADTGIIDAHVHLWDPSRFRMSWLDGNTMLDKPYLLDDYDQHTAGIDIRGMVYMQVEVEPSYGLLEAEWVADLARSEPRLQAIIPWAPLEYGEQARAYLDALTGISPLIKGVRRLIQSESVEFCLQPRFIHGVQLLADYDLSFDLCVQHRQLANVISLVRQCPETRFILDHIGKPAIKEYLLDPWREHITSLAVLPNVMCKMSGMVTEADMERWTAEDLRPYVDHVVASFGEDRILFGGDWPVVVQASSYRRWVDTLAVLTDQFSAGSQRRLWHDNAARFYRLQA